MDSPVLDHPTTATLMDGINAVRETLPHCWFDEHKCKQGIEALANYRKDWNDKAGTFRLRPVHDWASHGSDAFRYLALSLKPEISLVIPDRMYASAGGWMS
jgi:hypothetical protein